MPEHPVWFVSDRNPSITDTVTINGVAVDLSTKATTFKMRAVGSSTLKVNQAVSTKNSSGVWTYNWGASDLDTASTYLVWVTVDMGGGALETVNEAVIEVRAHAPGTNAYVELEEFKKTAELTGTSFSDNDIQTALIAASRGIDEAFGRRFYADTDANQIRYYSPKSAVWLAIDDLVTLTSLDTDQTGDGTFSNTWTVNTDFMLEPLNAAADSIPYQSIRVNPRSSIYFPTVYPRTVRVTGKFGWASVPAGIKTATTLVAARLVKRTREAPFGIVSFGLEGAAVRAAAMLRDPEFGFLAQTYSRNSGVA